MNKPSRGIANKLLLLVLKPVVGFCLRHSLRLQDLIECAKAVFVELGQNELERNGKKANISRLAAMSGVHRRDVLRLMRSGPAETYEKDLITKVVGLWQTSDKYTTARGIPRVLSLGAENSDFTKLVLDVSGDLNPGTVLFELERVGAVEQTAKGLKLLIESYVPVGDPTAGFKIYADDSSDLCQSIGENVLKNIELPHLHARTSYDRIRSDKVDEIKKWFLKEGHEFHSKVREKLSEFDQDVNPDPKWKGENVTVSFSSFSNVKKESGK